MKVNQLFKENLFTLNQVKERGKKEIDNINAEIRSLVNEYDRLDEKRQFSKTEGEREALKKQMDALDDKMAALRKKKSIKESFLEEDKSDKLFDKRNQVNKQSDKEKELRQKLYSRIDSLPSADRENMLRKISGKEKIADINSNELESVLKRWEDNRKRYMGYKEQK